MNNEYINKFEILTKAKQAIGLTFKEIDINNRLNSGKGDLGQIIEEGHFGYEINNLSEADFVIAEVELKVTPFIRGKRKTYSKERLVLSIIDYMRIHEETFVNSKFWEKNKSLLIIFYEYKKEISKGDFKIHEAILYEYPEDDLLIIMEDWQKIKAKIRAGKAHELSESDTLYLGACTKGSTAAKSLRKQPFSNIPAKQRAYSLKQSYMTYVLNSYVLGKESNERVIKNTSALQNTNFEDYILKNIKPYIGNTQESLIEKFGLNKSKGVNEIIISRMLGAKTRISQTTEFIKAGIIVKTIRVDKTGTKIKENMSFPAFKFTEIVKESWKESRLRNLLTTTRFMFAVFQFDSNESLVFKGVKFWCMPLEDIEGNVREVWMQTVKTVSQGVDLVATPHCIKNNLPKQSDNTIAHVRPHGRDSKDKYPLPDGRNMTKQSFWLNNSYIFEQIEDIL